MSAKGWQSDAGWVATSVNIPSIQNKGPHTYTDMYTDLNVYICNVYKYIHKAIQNLKHQGILALKQKEHQDIHIEALICCLTTPAGLDGPL